jgi:hypothetical protein
MDYAEKCKKVPRALATLTSTVRERVDSLPQNPTWLMSSSFIEYEPVGRQLRDIVYTTMKSVFGKALHLPN